MKPIAEHHHGTWFEIEMQEDAQVETERMRHAVAGYFAHDAKTAATTGVKAYRYFSFREGDRSLVTARVRVNGVDGSIVVGYQNADPYPDHGEAIAVLAAAIGADLPDSCYPYARHDASARL